MKGKRINYELLDTGEPAMSNPAVHFLDTHLNNTHELFEWGSGASTFWFAERCKSVVSVEYFEEFYDVIKERNTYDNLELVFQKPDNLCRKGYIAKFSSARGFSFYNFAHTIDQYSLFDVIVVDGRARNRCLDLAFSKLRQNGIIVYDDTNRKEYHDYMMKYADKFKKVFDFSGVTVDKKQTTTSVLYKKL